MNKLNALFLILVFIGCKSQVKDIDSLCSDTDRYIDCANKIESYQLNKYSQFVKRIDSKLYLKLDSGEDLVLQSNETIGDAVGYYFREFYEKANVYVFYELFDEDFGFKLINKANGESLRIIGKTKISPDNRKLVAYNCDLNSFINRKNGFQIISIEDSHFKIEFELEPKDWGPDNIIWKNDNEIEIERSGIVDNNVKTIEKINFIRTDNWTEKK